jgi:hypothetical protein
MEDDRCRIGSIGARCRCGTSRRKQEELCPSDLALIEPFTQEIVLDGLKRRQVAADRRRDERGEQLYLLLGKDGLQRDAASGCSIVGENPRLRLRTSRKYLISARAAGGREYGTTYCKASCCWAKVELMRISSIRTGRGRG